MIKSYKEVIKQYRNKCFSYYCYLMIEGSGSGARSGSISLTNGIGQIQEAQKHMDPTDKDPEQQHW
jgi:hypothetical protein